MTQSVLTSLSHTAVWVRVPLLAPAVAAAEGTPLEDTLLEEARAMRLRTQQQRPCGALTPSTCAG